MNQGKLVFAQLMQHVPGSTFRRCVSRYDGERKVHSFSCWDQFLCMAFAQLTYRESLRDIEACLRAQHPKLYHIGIRSQVSRNTLANANAVRDWRIHQDVAQSLIGIARSLYADEPFGAELDATSYALDASTIDLCLSLFPWATSQRTKAAVKLHTLLDLRGNIPTFLRITPGNVHDVRVLDEMPLEAGAFYVMDRGYLDFRRLHEFDRAGSFFVIRAKSNTQMRRQSSMPCDATTGVLSDQVVLLTGKDSQHHYPDRLRRIRFRDAASGRTFVYLTNNFEVSALSIAELYRCRWQVELFFKWIKQHLRIKVFFGHSENAVKTQIWTAVSTYALVAIALKRHEIDASLYQFLQVLSVTLFEKTPINQVISRLPEDDGEGLARKQLSLFD